MKTKISLKNIYLLLLISIGLVGLGIGSTFAMFTANATINNPIAFSSNLSSTNLLIDTIEVTVPAEEDRDVDLVVSNTSGGALYYSAWYKVSSNDVEVGSITSNNNYNTTGSIPDNTNFTLTVTLRNKELTPVTFTLGVSTDKNTPIVIPDNGTQIELKTLPEKTLYSVLQAAAQKGLYATTYTGAHQDAYDASRSTFDIYHYKAMANSGNTADQNGTAIRNMYNVVFADRCWQMIRTTDTGGVRLLYNGEPTVTVEDGTTSYYCGNNRPGHIGGIRTTKNLNGNNYKYGSNYTATFSGTTTTYTLTDVQTITVNSSNAATTISNITQNYPYTCGNTSSSCTTLYKVDGQSSGTNAYIYTSTFRDTVGDSAFNSGQSLGTGGYMYNKRYAMSSTAVSATTTYFTTSKVATSTYSSYLFSDSYTMDGNNHVLTNPVIGNTIADYPSSLKNMYYCKSSTNGTCASMFYVADVEVVDASNVNLYQFELTSGKQPDLHKDVFGDSITDNGDGTFKINNPVEVMRKDWYNNYNNNTNYMVNKYVCMQGYHSYDSNTDTYTCSDGNAQNVAALRYITASTKLAFTGTRVYKYGYGVEENNGTYKLIGKTTDGSTEEGTLQYIKNWPNTADTNCFTNSDTISDCGYKSVAKSHYTCFNLSGVCNTYYYINGTSTTTATHTIITDGKHVSTDVTDQESILYESLWKNDEEGTVNVTNSTIKNNVDSWYRREMYDDYDNYIDDTIYCNDRSISAFNSFNPNGGLVTYTNIIQFYGAGSSSLSCKRETDKFSTSNPKAQLTYKVGLMTYPEMNLLNSNNARTATSDYWLAGPSHIHSGNYYIYHYKNAAGGALNTYTTDTAYRVRPAISLKSTAIKYNKGLGTYDRPYVVDLSS